MTVAVYARPGARSAELDVEELKEQETALVALALMAVSAPAWLFSIPGAHFRAERFLVFFALFVAGTAAYGLRARCPILARAFLLVGPSLCLAWALEVFADPLVPAFAVLIVIANAAISPPLGLAAAALNTPALYFLLSPGQARLGALALLWLATAAQWVSSRGPLTVLAWAWESHQRANELLEELRDRRAELRQTVDALTEATRRLQRTGHELAVARLRADEARRLKEQFAANISHELRTPLNLIVGFSEMMYFSPEVYGDMAWPPTLRRDVRQIYQSSRQLLDLVNDVIDLARTDAAQMPLQKEPSDLGAIIQETVSITNGLVRGRELEVRTLLSAPISSLSLDRARIRQVLLNLLNNAARFTERGMITVAAEVREQEVVVSVADTGAGIAPEELPRIFDEFYQVDMSLRRRQEGAGLGLAISKRFVEMHGGRIWAESQLGVGSTFCFSLPLSPQASVLPLVSSPGVRPRPDSAQPCILVVDQDPGVGMAVSRYLKGYQVLQVSEPGQGQDSAREQHPRAVVLNVAPGNDLWHSMQQVLDALPAQVPAMVCSLPSQSWLAREVGVWGCLSKPVMRERLLAALAQVPGAREVLIVDDDRGFVELVARILEGTGHAYAVSWALEGEEALARIRERRPHVILLDLVMPGMGGLELLARLRANEMTRNIPVFIVTAASYSEDLIAERHGVIALGRKRGFSVSEVVRYLQAVLDATVPQCLADNAPGPAEAGSG